jgi:NADP-dependent 3-hydroxy acid dehydrogenase YdfG
MLVDGAVKNFGRIDALVNNAGVMSMAPMAALKVEEWDRQIDVNIKGVLYGIAAALPHMRRQERGHIINLGSVVGLRALTPSGMVYSGTKFAVHAISEGLRVELHSENIRVTTIAPGAFSSNLKAGTSDETSVKGLDELYKIAIPAEPIARTIAYTLEQPDEVAINLMVIRPTVQDF